MGKKIKLPNVVMDTNILISSLLFGGRLTILRELWVQRKIIPLISKQTFDELRKVLTYPKFSLTRDEIKPIVEDEILRFFEVVEIKETIQNACRDPHGHKFLSVAVNGKADYLISGDNKLFAL